jgi:inhibitor of cysteine peptidase
MLRKINLFICLVTLLAASACAPAEVKLTASDNGGQVQVEAGSLIVISLQANPSTGYTWEPRDLDPSMFELVGEPRFESDNPALLGAGEVMTLTFKTLQAGTATLTLVYHRPWETGVEPIDTFTVTVTVR